MRSCVCPSRQRSGAGVEITLELLHSLEECPLHKAAELLGVSTTALKKACRSLGVTRWQCKTRSQVTPLLNNGVAYARKLFRKYAKDTQPKRAVSPPASSCSETETVKAFSPSEDWQYACSPASSEASVEESMAYPARDYPSALDLAFEQRTFEELALGYGWSNSAIQYQQAEELLSSLECVWPDEL